MYYGWHTIYVILRYSFLQKLESLAKYVHLKLHTFLLNIYTLLLKIQMLPFCFSFKFLHLDRQFLLQHLNFPLFNALLHGFVLLSSAICSCVSCDSSDYSDNKLESWSLLVLQREYPFGTPFHLWSFLYNERHICNNWCFPVNLFWFFVISIRSFQIIDWGYGGKWCGAGYTTHFIGMLIIVRA